MITKTLQTTITGPVKLKAQQMAKQVGSILTNTDQELIEAALTAEELGNPARYVIEEKVSSAPATIGHDPGVGAAYRSDPGEHL